MQSSEMECALTCSMILQNRSSFFIRFLEIVPKESPIYINDIAKVTSNYRTFKASLWFDLILAVVKAERVQISKKEIVRTIFCLLVLVIAKNVL